MNKKMKKIALITLLGLVLTGCTTEADKYEQSARTELEKVIKKVAQNPENFKVSEMETAYKQDSMCVLRFTGEGQSELGERLTSRFEFVVVTTKQNTAKQLTMCMLQEYNEGGSVLDTYKDMAINPKSAGKKEFTRDDSIYFASFSTVVSSRQIYNSVVKDMTKDKDILEKMKKDGL